MLGTAVYGLTEYARQDLRGADLIALKSDDSPISAFGTSLSLSKSDLGSDPLSVSRKSCRTASSSAVLSLVVVEDVVMMMVMVARRVGSFY